MPNNIRKSAAVPFVNQKGERSMKRVKVERYVAGKRPAYAKEEDDDDEYYTTDDDEEEEEDDEELEDKDDAEESDEQSPPRKTREPEDNDCDKKEAENVKVELPPTIDEDEDDDPRFRRLKQLEARPSTSRIAEAHTSRIVSRVEASNVILEDEEDEFETRQRHALARAREVEEPIGPQAVFGDTIEQQLELRDSETGERSRRIQTEDILGDFELNLDEAKPEAMDAAAEKGMKEMLEEAKQEAIFKAQIYKKIEEDNKRELEKEALIKDGFNANAMESAKTDDEDEELAYEEWKLREIKRVLRDRSERALQVRGKA